jgi:hypothetical protein
MDVEKLKRQMHVLRQTTALRFRGLQSRKIEDAQSFAEELLIKLHSRWRS